MNKIYLALLTLVFSISLAGCSCKHTWAEADCVTPKTCTSCNETEGIPAGHVWLAATCDAPKTCEVCSATEGEAKGHSWVDATCTKAKHCELCDVIEGEILGHKWLDATTEAPQTCEICGLTDGDIIITDPRFSTASASHLLGKWSCETSIPAEAINISGFDSPITIMYTLEFKNDGTLTLSAAFADDAEVKNAFLSSLVEEMYTQFAAEGMSREEADVAVESIYGMTMEEVCKKTLDGLDVSTLLNNALHSKIGSYVYFIVGDHLYVASNWEDNFSLQPYTLDGDTLVIDRLLAAIDTSNPFIRIQD